MVSMLFLSPDPGLVTPAHRRIQRLLGMALVFLIVTASYAALADSRRPTPLEASGYQQLPDSARITAFLACLAQASPYVKVLSLGHSAGGREITALLVSKDPAFLNKGVSARDKLVVMLIGAQHGTEPSGAEALQIIARDLLHGALQSFLQHMDMILIPNSNADGRDLHRRVNANNVNLSTDYLVLSQPESLAVAKAWHRFKPHVLLDVHESALLKKKSLGTQGYMTDFEAQFEVANHANLDVRLRVFSLNVFLPELLAAINARGLPARRYISEITSVDQPITPGGISLRNLRNYVGFRGTFSLLVENRLDPPGDYPTPHNIRVRVAKQLLSIVTFLEKVREFRGEIIERVEAARDNWVNKKQAASVTLDSYYARDPAQPRITIPLRKRYNGELVQRVFDYHGRVVTDRWLTLPRAYAVTAQQEAIARLLQRHQIRYEVIQQPKELQGVCQLIKKVQIKRLFHGVIPRREVQVSLTESATPIALAPGDLWIDLHQPAARLVPLILDPRSTNNIFYHPAFTSWLAGDKCFFVIPIRTKSLSRPALAGLGDRPAVYGFNRNHTASSQGQQPVAVIDMAMSLHTRLHACTAIQGALVFFSAFLGVNGAIAGTEFAIFYDVNLLPKERAARVAIRLEEGAQWVRYIQLRIDPQRHQDFAGDGRIERMEGGVRWMPPPEGGELRYTFRIEHRRNNRGYDGYVTKDWALFRGDDLVPATRLNTLEREEAKARMRLRLPPGWSAVTPYPKNQDSIYTIEHPEWRFDRPAGWMVCGRLGVLRERIVGSRVAVAEPVGQGLHHQDIPAFLRWTLPELKKILGRLPQRLLIVGAGDPMWRGGLSGPNSLYIHVDRPLIASDGTSPLIHELIHVAMRARSGPGGDWIVEGLAELYSLELLRRSGTISHRRYKKTLAKLEQQGRAVEQLAGEDSSGKATAHAAYVLYRLDRQIRKESGDRASLDNVLQAMAAVPEAWTPARFRELCEKMADASLESFFRRWAPETAHPG
jgi:hypothetical protein